MKKSLLFLPLLGLASNVAAQELRGVVTDADNNPLVGASVYWAETTIGASTSATGAYTVHRVKNYDRLVASYLGYVNDTIRIADGVAEQNFRLRSEGVDIEGVVVESTLGGNYVKRDGILKGETISFAGLCKMACCNLAESFENSASVTVGYSDAISGCTADQDARIGRHLYADSRREPPHHARAVGPLRTELHAGHVAQFDSGVKGRFVGHSRT